MAHRFQPGEKNAQKEIGFDHFPNGKSHGIQCVFSALRDYVLPK